MEKRGRAGNPASKVYRQAVKCFIIIGGAIEAGSPRERDDMQNRADGATYGDGHAAFRETVRAFLTEAFKPDLDRFEDQGRVDRSLWEHAGELGLLCPTMPAEYGGLGLDFSFNAEFTYAMMSDCLTLQTDITMPYILHYGSEEMKRRILSGMLS
jgi:acyl-CoA dehydrogenase